jgi:hypothetical protein
MDDNATAQQSPTTTAQQSPTAGPSIEQRVAQLEEFVAHLADKVGAKKQPACPKHPEAVQSVNGCTAPGCTFPG